MSTQKNDPNIAQPVADFLATRMSKAKAADVCDRLNADPLDDWTYRVQSIDAVRDIFAIAIYDETGEAIGNL